MNSTIFAAKTVDKKNYKKKK